MRLATSNSEELDYFIASLLRKENGINLVQFIQENGAYSGENENEMCYNSF